jgi:hypothetical protein
LSAKAARELHVFVPDSSQPPSARAARARIAARSLPASGSDQACAQISSARAIGGSSRACCSLLPCRSSVGPSRKIPFWPTRTGAAAA